jgi:hypothetical protein
MGYDERIKLEALRDHFEVFSKGGNYLIVGHAAGFVGCLSVVREQPDLPPPFHHVGLFVLLFGAGLLLGSLFWAISMMIKISVTQAIISQTPPSPKWWPRLKRKSLEWLGLFGLWASWLAFVTAIGLIMFQFKDAFPDLVGGLRLRPGS